MMTKKLAIATMLHTTCLLIDGYSIDDLAIQLNISQEKSREIFEAVDRLSHRSPDRYKLSFWVRFLETLTKSSIGKKDANFSEDLRQQH